MFLFSYTFAICASYLSVVCGLVFNFMPLSVNCWDTLNIILCYQYLIIFDTNTILSAFKSNTDQANIETKMNNKYSKTYYMANSKQTIITCGYNKVYRISHRTEEHKCCIIKINHNIIERVNDFNFLGLIINYNLSWKAMQIKSQIVYQQQPVY